MKQPHKHAALIHAWADGAEIEYKNRHGEWHLAHNPPMWAEDGEYRIKPEPKPDLVRFVCVESGHTFRSLDDNLCITFDGETGKLKKAEVLE